MEICYLNLKQVQLDQMDLLVHLEIWAKLVQSVQLAQKAYLVILVVPVHLANQELRVNLV